MAVTAREQAIIDLHERGSSGPEIAAKLGLSEGYVRRRITMLCSGLGLDSRERKMMAEGSRMLRTRIAQFHPERTAP